MSKPQRFKNLGDLPPEVFDPARLAAVAASGLMDSAPEEVFDDLAGLAASMTGAPFAFVTVLDARSSFWKSAVGMGKPPDEKRYTPAEESPCHLIVAGDAPLIVDDAANDPRLDGLAAIGELGVRAWAGHPVHGPGGEVLGALCVADTVPRAWSAGQVRALGVLARAVSSEIALRDAVGRMRRQMADLRAFTEMSTALARTLQESLLPPVLTSPPGVDAAARYVPAGDGTTVLGDFYDLFPASASRWCAILGDVSGHGVEAAKVTALARYTVRADAPRHISATKVLDQLNTALLAQHVSAHQFLTAICAIFRIDGAGVTGVLCTAGHPSALLRRTDGSVEEVRSAGAILGVFPDAGLKNVRFTLEPGEVLLLYTDGVTEARPPASPGLFGDQRLHDLLASCADLDAQAVVDRVTRTVLDFCREAPGDDIAILALRIPPAP
ncbi:PP2C family protein-serine/threonine phosphatase [Sphaerisporangium corydalis]|uniref:PP2C family protein-serine/threonine phosphatase n=1 Tax=Sphaerisporangium corydalis TaxID=1441875 RepID=A0ABV9EM48_9ACTN|nr:GAF domain-containing SpoIIE family protein phosphatase [Sphaerisporangium corydalis]